VRFVDRELPGKPGELGVAAQARTGSDRGEKS
jgi:hypothetical protein